MRRVICPFLYTDTQRILLKTSAESTISNAVTINMLFVHLHIHGPFGLLICTSCLNEFQLVLFTVLFVVLSLVFQLTFAALQG